MRKQLGVALACLLAEVSQAAVTETELYTEMFSGPPKIVKMGAVSPYGECSPFVWKGKLLRLELEDDTHGLGFVDGRPMKPRAIIRDVASGNVVSATAEDCYYHAVYVEGEHVYMTCRDNKDWSLIWMFETTDLKTWTRRELLRNPDSRFCNTTLTKGPDGYVMALEVDTCDVAPTKYTMVFATSPDLKVWKFMDYSTAYPAHRYSGGPFLTYSRGWYYLFILQEMPNQRYCTYLNRTKDFRNWEIGRYNPFLMWSEEDRTISPTAADISPEYAKKIRTGFICNASDVEMCEFGGRTYINYLTGDQHGHYYMCEAWYDGLMEDLLANFFK